MVKQSARGASSVLDALNSGNELSRDNNESVNAIIQTISRLLRKEWNMAGRIVSKGMNLPLTVH